MVTSIYDAKYMALALAMIQQFCLMNTLEDLNIPVSNAAMYSDDMTTIHIAYNHKIDNRSHDIDCASYLGQENVESGRILLLHVELGINVAYFCTKGLPQVTLWKLQTSIILPKCGGKLHFRGYFTVLL
jgi:hypothetical protein